MDSSSKLKTLLKLEEATRNEIYSQVDGAYMGEKWLLNGQYHRNNGPARIDFTNDSETHGYYKLGQRHREDGPGIIVIDRATGAILHEMYYLDGVQYSSKAKWQKALQSFTKVTQNDEKPFLGRYECVNETSSKFWEVTFEPNPQDPTKPGTYIITAGKLGTPGKVVDRWDAKFDTTFEHMRAKVKEKLRKGYVKV